MSLIGKVYTAQDMRNAAKCLFACEVDLEHDNRDIARMLRQSADMMDRAVGNAAAMRKALEKFNAVDLSGLEFPLDGDSSTIYNSNKKEITIPYWRIAELLNGAKEAQDMAKAALSAPPRNCDVGTAEEQRDRLEDFCSKHFRYSADNPCSGCPIYNGDSRPCVYRFLQMPYEEEGAE